MAQMPFLDIYAVAAASSEIKLMQISTGAGKGPKSGSTALNKTQTLVEHRNKSISIAFSENICASVAADN